MASLRVARDRPAKTETRLSEFANARNVTGAAAAPR
jgi:hypothetical protein